MGEPNNQKNKMSGRQAEIPPFEKEPKNHNVPATNDKDISVDAETPERKPIKNILVVDDEKSIRELFKSALEKFGYETVLASDGNEAMALFRKSPADLIITDIFMPDKDGHSFIFEVRQEFPGTKIFAITGKNTTLGIETELDIAQDLGAVRGFIKPVKLVELIEAIKEL